MKTRGSATLLFRLFSLHFVLSALGLASYGQTADLSGAITDSSRAVVPGASITIVKESTGLKQVTSSSDQGFYHFSFLQPGFYTITVEVAGFRVESISGAKLDPGQDGRLDFTIVPAGLKQSVTVRGSFSSLQTESPAVGTEVDQQLVRDLPLNGRTFQSLIGLAPGVVRPGTLNQVQPQSGTFINGQRATTNYVSVDGVSANVGDAGGQVPVSTVLGTTHNLVAIDDMQEFKLLTSTYSAEFGRAPGGQLEVVTRSGSNQFHGLVFDYFRNEALDANDWFSNANGLPRGTHRQNDFGGIFGGPIRKNRTFFFFSYEGLRLQVPLPFQTRVPSLGARQTATGAIQQLLNAFPPPNRPEDPATMSAPLIGTASNPTSSNNTSIRIDDMLNQKITLFGRYSEAPSEQTQTGFVNNPKKVASFRSITFGATILFSAKTTSDLRVNYSRAEGSTSFGPVKTGGAVQPPNSLLFPAPFASPSSSLFTVVGLGTPFTTGRSSERLQRQGNVVSSTSIIDGRHELRLGVDYRYLAPYVGPPSYQQHIFFQGVRGAITGVAGLARINSADQVTLGVQELALYGEDSWKVSPRLTLTYGLRWELNPPPHVKGNEPLLTLTGFPDLGNLQLAPPGTPMYNTTYGDFAPRVGAAYQLFRQPGRESVIRGGFGVYYDLGAGYVTESATSFPHSRRMVMFNVPYPLSSEAAAPPPPVSLNPPYDGDFYVFAPDHRLPRTYHWNLTVDQMLGTHQVVSVSYVGEAGRSLLRQNALYGLGAGFSNGLNPAIFPGNIYVITNHSSSDYHALQVQFQRRMTRSLAALLSYTWSHSIDDTSQDEGGDNLTDPRIDRGASDFDIRQAFNAGVTYNIPGANQNRVLHAILSQWSVDSIFTARTALPINVFVDLTDTGIYDSYLNEPRPDRAPGVPLYIKGAAFPGGRRVNPAAFSAQSELRQGNLERNLVRGFPLTQLDFAVRRQFGIGENVKLQMRADLFNLLNHPNFGLVDGNLGLFGQPFQPNATFGIAAFTLAQFGDVDPLYCVGGARSIQLSLQLRF